MNGRCFDFWPIVKLEKHVLFEFAQLALRLDPVLLAVRSTAIFTLPVRVQKLRRVATVPHSALLRYVRLLDHLGSEVVLVDDLQLVGGIPANAMALLAIPWRVLAPDRLLLVLPSLQVAFDFALLIVCCKI